MTQCALQPAVSVLMMLFGRLGTLGRSLADIERQVYDGPWRLMLWNNNYAERAYVDEVVSRHRERLEVETIHSERNHHCLPRQSLAALCRSELVLLMDDDILPSPDYIAHFVAAYQRLESAGPEPVAVCACAHRFSPDIVGASAKQVWEQRLGLEFLDEQSPEIAVHFMHANNCMMSRATLLRTAGHPPPDPEFGLVDDYWMSYVLSAKLGARLVKIEAASVLEFAPDAFDPAVAMFSRLDVHQARLRLFDYLSHYGWPRFDGSD